MRKKPNFEQVPLEVVKKIVEDQVNQEERVGAVGTTPIAGTSMGKAEKT